MVFGSHQQLIYIERAESQSPRYIVLCARIFFVWEHEKIRIYGLFFEGCSVVSSPEACFKHNSTNVLRAMAQLRNMRDEVKRRAG